MIIYRAIAGDLFKATRITGIAAVSIGLGIWLAGIAITMDADASPAAINGSLQHLPAVIALCGFAFSGCVAVPLLSYGTRAAIVM